MWYPFGIEGFRCRTVVTPEGERTLCVARSYTLHPRHSSAR